MKTVLRILVILMIAVAVSGGVYALVENTSLVSSSDAEMGPSPQMISAVGTSIQPTERHEGGDEHGASFTRGLSEVLVTLGELTVITIVIVLLQKGSDLLRKMKLKTI